MRKHSRLVWMVVVVLGWLLDFLFWKQQPGINFAVYAFLCLAAGFFLLRLDGARIANKSLWLVPPIVAFALISFVRLEPLTMSLAVLMTLFFMALLAVTFLGGRWLEYGLPDYALGFLRLAWSVVIAPFGFNAATGRTSDSASSPGKGPWPVVRGLLLALPIVVVFAALLSSADLIFQSKLDELVRLLSLERLPEYLFRLVYIVAAAVALLGVYLHAATRSRDERLIEIGKSLEKRLLGFTESSVVLGSVILLFVGFVMVQFRYFFGGGDNIGLEGYTFAEYARRGYGELMAVAFLSLALLLGLGAVTRRESRRQTRAFSILSITVVLLVGVMLISAYMRLGLYEMAYGFTRLRTYVHVSLIWLGLLLAAVVLLEAFRRERFFAAAALFAAAGFALTLGVLNVDGFIVRQNVGRALRGQGLDLPHLASLSTDSVPALVEFYRSPSLLPETKLALGAAIACQLQLQPAPSGDWRSFTISRWRARLALDSVRTDIERYQVDRRDGSFRVISPGGLPFKCWDEGLDSP